MVTLDACPLFRALKPDELQALRQAAREKSFAAGQEIQRGNDPLSAGLCYTFIYAFGQSEIIGAYYQVFHLENR